MNNDKTLQQINLLALISVLIINAAICLMQSIFTIQQFESANQESKTNKQNDLTRKIQKSSIQLLVVLLLDVLVIVLCLLRGRKSIHVLEKFLAIFCIFNSISMWPVFDQGQIEVILQVNFIFSIVAPFLVTQQIVQIISIHLLLSMNNLTRRLYFVQNAKAIDTSVLLTFGVISTVVGILILKGLRKD